MKKTITNLKDIENKKILVRLDLNVPIDNKKIVDNNRIIQSLPTLNYLIEKGGKIIIFSHLGRIKSESDKEKKSLKIVGEELSKLLNKNVIFVKKTRGKELENKINSLKKGDVLLVENTRFEDFINEKVTKYESSCDGELSKYWASLGDVFVNDAFGTLHRKHASNYGISINIKEKVIGFLVKKELEVLEKIKMNPERPFVVILGGAKISDKVGVIDSMLKIADKVIIGPAMSYTFRLATNHLVGKSLIDESKIEYAKNILKNNSEKIIVAFDSIAVKEINDDKNQELKSYEEIPDDYMGVDLGEKSIKLIQDSLKNARTIFWNGPLGIIENDKYSNGSKEILNSIVNLKNVFTVIGGGDSGLMTKKLGLEKRVSYISTGGGASLKFLENKEMPSLELIEDI
ncbi:MAG: phosphoglycerate kinase [Candidatus Hepatoplasma vulgare]|nr:MAG: phosphoglycerate kinase [Candidatus Hepatoplasma sp.]